MAGRLMCMAHVAVIFPSAYYSVVQPYAVAVVQKAAESPLLKDSFPQINEIIVAQKLSCYVGWFALAWCILSPLPAIKLFQHPILSVFTAVDGMIGAVYMYTAVNHGRYLPLSCYRSSEEWHTATDSRSRLFRAMVMAQLEDDSNPETIKVAADIVCEITTFGLGLELSLLFIFLMVSIYGTIMLLLCGTRRPPTRGERVYLHPPLRFLGRCCGKYRQYRRSRGLKPSAGVSGSEMTPDELDVEAANGMPMTTILRKSGGEPLELLRIFSVYPIMLPIVEHIHQVDLYNLTLTSKSVRNSVFAAVGSDLHALERRTCFGSEKGYCWSCGTQICEACQTRWLGRDTLLTHHSEDCNLFCNRCFHREHLSRKEFMRDISHCRCNETEIDPRALCRNCYLSADPKEPRQRRMGRAMALRGDLECIHCGDPVSKPGPRWWRCKVCKRECTADCHPVWGTW